MKQPKTDFYTSVRRAGRFMHESVESVAGHFPLVCKGSPMPGVVYARNASWYSWYTLQEKEKKKESRKGNPHMRETITGANSHSEG